jgi:hypothetical protein
LYEERARGASFALPSKIGPPEGKYVRDGLHADVTFETTTSRNGREPTLTVPFTG